VRRLADRGPPPRARQTRVSGNGATGVISGVPKRRGTFPFVVSVQDALGTTVAIGYALRIVR
jgi:hypothetical protein